MPPRPAVVGPRRTDHPRTTPAPSFPDRTTARAIPKIWDAPDSFDDDYLAVQHEENLVNKLFNADEDEGGRERLLMMPGLDGERWRNLMAKHMVFFRRGTRGTYHRGQTRTA